MGPGPAGGASPHPPLSSSANTVEAVCVAAAWTPWAAVEGPSTTTATATTAGGGACSFEKKMFGGNLS